jgi:hypothetical protein
MVRLLRAFFGALLDALRAWQRDREHDAAIKAEAHATNDKEDLERDVENAERITRAVDAVRSAGGVRDPGTTTKPDTRGYRD